MAPEYSVAQQKKGNKKRTEKQNEGIGGIF